MRRTIGLGMFDGFETCGSILSRLMLFDLLLFIAREMRRCCSAAYALLTTSILANGRA